MKIVAPRHGRTTVILLSARPDKSLEPIAVRHEPGATRKTQKRSTSLADDY
jgi:hypothetical protein